MAEDRTPTVMLADPAPLGLAAFALTTFLISVHNIGAPDLTWFGLALFYGGAAQFAAGMWEFKRGNVFGATAFGSFGAFWLGLAGFVGLVLAKQVPAAQVHTDVGWFMLAFAIFCTYMLAASARVNLAVFGVFLTLDVTLILLFIGNFANATPVVVIAGVVGVITALVAWYTSFAGLLAGMGHPILPVGNAPWRSAAPEPEPATEPGLA
ncbi:MAG: acetate uptake transporter [Candidatus Dormibacteraeota bacterium]|nr:acetate uptake transporter [Candidatus Dormibacteraeota bacterium]